MVALNNCLIKKKVRILVILYNCWHLNFSPINRDIDEFLCELIVPNDINFASRPTAVSKC